MSYPFDHLETTQNPWGIIPGLGLEWPEGRGGFQREYGRNPSGAARLAETFLGMRNWAAEEDVPETVRVFEELVVFLYKRFPAVRVAEVPEDYDSELRSYNPLYVPDEKLLHAIHALTGCSHDLELQNSWPSATTTRTIYTYYPHAAGRLLETLFGMRALQHYERIDETIVHAIEAGIQFIAEHCPEALQAETLDALDDPDRDRGLPQYVPDSRLVQYVGELTAKFAETK